MFWPWRTFPINPYPIYRYPLTYYQPITPTVPAIERYTIRLGQKTDINPWKGQGSDVGYLVTLGPAGCTGTSGARLDLQYGRTYAFDIYTSIDCTTGEPRSEPFFFTTDPSGGSSNGEIFSNNINPSTPITNGTVYITITNNLPQQFYYQSSRSRKVGGPVFLQN